MLFSSVIFLFLFLPAAWAAYYLSWNKGRNPVLLLASLVFYVWGGREQVFILLLSVLLNYAIGISFLLFDRLGAARMAGVAASGAPGSAARADRVRRLLLVLGISLNLALLAFYKYFNFFVSNLSQTFGWLGLGPLPMANIVAPLGISFFTFHALSYLCDIYQAKGDPQRNPINLALYLTVFPKILAGPILKYQDAEHQLADRTLTSQAFLVGIRRFIVGLGKKTLIANPLAAVADKIFAIPANELSPDLAWLGLVCFTLQIYFDFSGYTDMAIGLGKTFGFEFPENFNFPYISQSVQEFWRRWHISLSTWFRDYLYIPLGGNRCSSAKQYRNLIVVFVLCGFWHGASWNFILWGLWYGLFLVLERLEFGQVLRRAWRPLRHCYALGVVVLGWVLFRTDDLNHAFHYFVSLLGLNAPTTGQYYLALYLDPEVLLVLLLGAVGAMPVAILVQQLASGVCDSPRRWSRAAAVGFSFVDLLFLGSLFLLSCMAVAGGTYNPFIYFKF